MGLVDGKVALVTGASGGIGRAGARIFAREGAKHVYVADLKRNEGNETVEMIRGAGGAATYLHLDVTDEDAVAAAIAGIVADHGRLDCAWNNAGITDPSRPFHELAREDWDRMIAVNLTGVFLCMKHEIRQMLSQGGGAICNTSSGAGIVPAPGQPHYTAAKHGVLGLTKTAASELNNSKIRVNAVCPGMVDTPMMAGWFESSPEIANATLQVMPGRSLMAPEEIGEAGVWLCSDGAYGVSGLSMVIDRGFVNR